MSKETETSPLVAAALEFDAELRRFARAAEAAQKRPLHSKRDLEKAAEALREAAESEEALGPKAQALLQALTAARDLQQTQSLAARERATAVQERYQMYGSLMNRVQQIGDEAVSLTDMAKQITARKREDGPLRQDAELVAGLVEIEQRMAQAAENARALAEEARDNEFEEVARDAHGLQQTLVATRNKITLLQRAIGVQAEASDA